MLTADEHQDLSLRLEALLISFAPASDRQKATAQLHEVLATVPIADPAAPADAPASHDT